MKSFRTAICLGAVFALGGAATTAAAEGAKLDPALLAHHATVRDARLRLELRDASPDELAKKLAAISNGPRHAAAVADYLTTVELLARHRGAPAIELARDHSFGDIPASDLREAFIRGWSSRAPEAAADWIEKNAASDWADDEHIELLKTTLRAEARRDAKQAMARAFRHAATDPSRGSTYPLIVIEELAYVGEFKSAHELSAAVDDRGLRSALLATLVMFAVEHVPTLAFEWFRDLPHDAERSSAMFRTIETLASRRLSEAADFYATLPAEDRSVDLAETMLVNGSNFSPKDAEPLLEIAPAGEGRDRLLTAALARLGVLSPEGVPWEWFAQFANISARNELLLNLLASRRQQDAAAATAVVKNLSFLSAEERAELQQALTASAP